MSEKTAVEFERVGKMYRLYKSRMDSLLDITSLGRLAPWWNPKIDNFWALRNVSFRLKAGSRLGIIGRNGAGKTTLLKLMTGNIAPTEGRIKVQGEVQALLEAGAGFHPEFTGYDNIEASLVQNGLTRSQIKSVVEEIADFTELGDFLNQPFKTYSAGMQARLVFTTATAVRPEILIIDEILGAGDAYFAVKSRSRMRQLVDSGASILLVAHAMDQILLFCEEAIWLERGRIVLRGPSLEVVKAYEEFIHTLQDRQLKAANRQRKPGFRDAVEIGRFADNFVLVLIFTGEPGSHADISTVELWSDVNEETVRIGEPQDSDATYPAYVITDRNNWGESQAEGGVYFRSLEIGSSGSSHRLGQVGFRSYGLEAGERYAFRIRYRIIGEGRLAVTVNRNGKALFMGQPIPDDREKWLEHEVALPQIADQIDTAAEERPEASLADCIITEVIGTQVDIVEATGSGDVEIAGTEPAAADIPAGGGASGAAASEDAAALSSRTTLRRWPGEGSLLVDDVVLLDPTGQERAVYEVGSPLTLLLHYRAARTGEFPVMYAVVIYRVDGIRITQHVSSRETVHIKAGEHRSVELQFPSMDLADGRYIISVSLHRDLDPQFPNETVRYDLVSHSYQFEIIGNPPLRTSLFVLPAKWKL
jgi:ABC-type polysaccharide/polyol phosphate transport system ATPase subunit